MTDRTIEADRFAESVDDILNGVSSGVRAGMPEVVRAGIRKGASAWRRNIKRNFKTGAVYRKHGQTYTVGAYSKSVRSHMTDTSGDRPSGEVGVPKMPGLPHLLEFGHAKVGGGRVPGREHVAPAADVAFEAAQQAAESMVDGVLRDA